MSGSAVTVLYRSLLRYSRKFDQNVGAKMSLMKAVYPELPPSLIRSAAPFCSVQAHVKARFRSPASSLSDGFACSRLFSSMYSYCCLWTNVLERQQGPSLKKGMLTIAHIIDPNYDATVLQRGLDFLTREVQQLINNDRKSNATTNQTLVPTTDTTRKTLQTINQFLFSGEKKILKGLKELKTYYGRVVAMCAVYEELASGVGIQLHPIYDSSGYFLLKYQPAHGETLIIDAYKSGKIMTVDEAKGDYNLPDLHLNEVKLNLQLFSLLGGSKRAQLGKFALQYAPSAREGGQEREERTGIAETQKEMENRKKTENECENVLRKQETLATRKKGASV